MTVGRCTAILAGGGDERRGDDDHGGNKETESLNLWHNTVDTSLD